MGGPDGRSPTEYCRERVSTRKETAMPGTRTRTVVLIGASFYLAVMSFAGGVATERIRFDRERGEVLHCYDEAVQEWHEFRMAAERRLSDGSSTGAHASPAVR
jgi:hypothetical protein